MTAKLILDGDRVVLHKQDGSTEVRPGKRRLSEEEVAELMSELQEGDDASGKEQGH